MKKSLWCCSFVLSAAVLLYGCASDPSDPTDPDPSTGSIYGTVQVLDENYNLVPDRSGITARYHDTDGRNFEAVTNVDGVWEFDAPLGVYTLDTIVHPSMIQIFPGDDGVSGNNNPISFLGKGRHKALHNTEFSPPSFGEIDILEFLSSSLDSSYNPGDPSHGIPEQYTLNVVVRVLRTTPLQNGSQTAFLILPDQSRHSMRVDGDRLADPWETELSLRYESNASTPIDWQGAQVELKSWSVATQTYFVPSPDSLTWFTDHRVVPSDTTTGVYDIP